MTDININEVYEELKYEGELPETSRLINDYLALREENASLKKSVERWMQYHETAKGERDACLDELKKKDAEIDRFREYLREAVEWSCGNPDDNCGDCAAHGGDTPCVCEKWRNALKGGAK